MPDTLPSIHRPTIRSCWPRSSTTTTARSRKPPRGSTISAAVASPWARPSTDFRIGYANRTLGLKLPIKQTQGRQGNPHPAATTRHLSGHRPRTLQRLRRVPDHGRRWQRADRGHLRPEDTTTIFARERPCTCTCRTTAGRVERRGVPGRQRNHPLSGRCSTP